MDYPLTTLEIQDGSPSNKRKTIPFMDYPVTTMEINQLLDTVKQNDLEQFITLLPTIGEKHHAYKKSYLEAHLLCRSKIIKILETGNSWLKENIMSNIVHEYSQRVNIVFEATKKGSYKQGVKPLLKCYELPATIRDPEGRSLLHVAASAKDLKLQGKPKWKGQNLRDFLIDNICYMNAVDFKGKTCLHHLTGQSHDSKENVSYESSWVEIADILVQHGCNATLKDHEGKLAYDYAETAGYLQLGSFLREACNKTNNGEFATSSKKLEDHDEACLREIMISWSPKTMENYRNTSSALTIKAEQLRAALRSLNSGVWLDKFWNENLESFCTLKSVPAVFLAIMTRERTNKLNFDSSQKEQTTNRVQKLKYLRN